MDVHLLGPVEAFVDGRPVALGATKQRALLALLALEAGHTVSADRLVEGLWGDDLPPSAHKMVQHYVSQLRRVLDGDGAEIVTHGRGYELRLGGDSDVARFERLLDGDGRPRPRDALRLWRGPPLADVADAPFAAAAIRRLEDLRLRAVELAIDADLAAGRHREVLAEIDDLVAQHPLSERLHGQHMLALYRSGRQAEALEAFRHARRVLVEEAGIEPGPDLRALHDAMLRQDPALERDRPPPPPPPGGAADAAVPARSPRRRALGVAAAVALIAGGAALAAALLDGDDGLAAIGEDGVGRLDGDGRIAARYALGGSPSAAVSGGDSVWVASEHDRTVTRIDPRGERVATISVGAQPISLTYGSGSVWVADGAARRVLRVDPRDDRVVQSFAVANVPRAVVAGFGSIWVATAVDGGLTRIDLARGTVGPPLRVGGSPTALAAGAGSVWAASESAGTVTRIDPRSGDPVRTVAVGGAPTALAVGAGGVWIANRDDDTVTRIDPTRSTVTDTVRVGRAPVAVATDGDTVWVANSEDGTLSRIDAGTRRVTRTVDVGGGPAGLAFAAGSLWAATAGDASAHRGGTLRVGIEDDQWSVDPASALSYAIEPFQLMPLAYDGLVAYRRVGGAGGSQLVAALAESVPQPSGDGLTYVFRLRHGLRYADGAAVRAADFRASLERVLRSNEAIPRSYDSIRGAAACLAGRERCDLSAGIRSDERSRTIVIRLVRPDADLLHKLALPVASVLPGGGEGARRTAPPPGTGPYRILPHDERGVRFVRNPRFRSWSRDARPDGFADEIRYGLSDARSADVQNGFTPQDRSSLRALTTRFGGRLRAESAPMTQYLFLNTRRPPFDDVRVRRAVNFAADRRRILSLVGGAEAAAITCRLLPPGYPGYRPACPFTRDPTPAGGWTAPDLDRARRLVRAAGARGAPATVWAAEEFGAIGPYFRDLLRDLGLRPSLRQFADTGRYFSALNAGRSAPDAGINVWIADLLTSSTFFDPLFTCAGGPFNYAQLCDRRLDKLIARAVPARDPGDADARWDAVERRISALAPIVPLLNGRSLTILSERAGNFQHHPLWGVLLERVWVDSR